MLFVFNGIVFAGVQFAIVVMRMGSHDGSGGGRKVPLAALPARVPVSSR
jgi:hypothetical protein